MKIIILLLTYLVQWQIKAKNEILPPPEPI